MTLKEKLETIKGKKIAIWCETKEEAQYLVDELNKITGEDCGTYYDDEECTCYALDEYDSTGVWCYSPKDYYKEESGFQIISYKDFVNNYIGDCKVHLNDGDIIKILDDKYGKDNCVMN